MNCPKCGTRALRSISRVPSAATVKSMPQRCEGCGGLWVARQAVPELHESGVLEDLDAGGPQRAESDKRNGLCPEGHGILARARVSWEEPYFVERCATCDGLWLDAGEWSRLRSEHLLEHLDELWLPSWRKRIRDEAGRARLERELRDKLGDALFEAADQLGRTLAEHRHGDLALAYVRELVRRHRSRLREGEDAGE